MLRRTTETAECIHEPVDQRFVGRNVGDVGPSGTVVSDTARFAVGEWVEEQRGADLRLESCPVSGHRFVLSKVRVGIRAAEVQLDPRRRSCGQSSTGSEPPSG